jgi:DNA-binding FadR family transcriptional regulator
MDDDPRVDERRFGLTPAAGRRRKLPDVVAERIRDMIAEGGLRPGDRVPPEWLSLDRLGVSRGTQREAMKILEIQGLITSKTGPGGGAFISEITADQAIQLLDNLFLFQPPSVADIYAIRKLIEPEIAAGSAGRLSAEAFAALQATIRLYEGEPQTADEEYAQRLAELDFHVELARHSDNALLSFVARFLLSLLRDMTECRAIYSEPHPELRETGLHYQVRLLRALKAGDAEKARAIMLEHMTEAEKYMLERAAIRRRARPTER